MEGYKSWQTLFQQQSTSRLLTTKQQQQFKILQYNKILDQIQRDKKQKKQILKSKTKQINLKTNRLKSLQNKKNEAKIKQIIINEQAQSNCLKQKIQDICRILIKQKNENEGLQQQIKIFKSNDQEVKRAKYKSQSELQLIKCKIIDQQRENLKQLQMYNIKLKQKIEERQNLKQYIKKQQGQKYNYQRQKEQKIKQKIEQQLKNTKQQQIQIYSKNDIKHLLRLFLELYKKVTTVAILKQQDVNILSKQQTRINSKLDIIKNFEIRYFLLNQQFSQKIINGYQYLIEQLSKKQKLHKLLQQKFQELKDIYQNISKFNQYQAQERLFHQSYQKIQEEIQIYQIQKGYNQKHILLFNNFMSIYIQKLMKIVRIIQKIIVQTRTACNDHIIKKIVDNYSQNKIINRYLQLIKINQQQKQIYIRQISNNVINNQLKQIMKNNIIIRLFFSANQISEIMIKNQGNYCLNNINNDKLYKKILDEAYNLQNYFIEFNLSSYKDLISYISKKLKKMQNIKKPIDCIQTYEVQSPQYYRFDNFKILDKINKKSNVVDKDILQQIKNHNKMIIQQQNKKNKNKLFFIFKFLNQSTIFNNKNNYNNNKTQNSLRQNDMSTLLSQRRKINQLKNIKIRSMLNMVQKIGTNNKNKQNKNRFNSPDFSNF